MLRDDPQLLALLLADANDQPSQYQPGPFWRRNAENAAEQLEAGGLHEFRGDSNTIGFGYTDAVYLDVRHALRAGTRRRILHKLLSSFPLKRIFDNQVALTRTHADATRRLRRLHMEANPAIPALLDRYRLPDTLLGGCVETVEIGGQTLSMHYLTLLETHDQLAKRVDFSRVRSMFEIGGGFGANVHLLMENYPSIRKVVYLDIPPNIYVGTQYLKAFYGDAVVDYRKTRKEERISFRADDSREILCIAPWQIEKLDLSLDLFYNAHSFVEMPQPVVANYASHVTRLDPGGRTVIALVSYLPFDPGTTFDPKHLPDFFTGRRFESYCHEMLDASQGVIGFVTQPTR